MSRTSWAFRSSRIVPLSEAECRCATVWFGKHSPQPDRSAIPEEVDVSPAEIRRRRRDEDRAQPSRGDERPVARHDAWPDGRVERGGGLARDRLRRGARGGRQGVLRRRGWEVDGGGAGPG